ncbi:MAG: VanW family protein [Tetrasphaera sp.]|nr:VanW family protein [Tetrasphaera sp.]
MTADRRPGRPSRRRWPIVTGGVLLLAAAGYAALAAATSGGTPAHTTIAGVAVGGLDRAAAEATLRAALATRAAAPVRITFGAKEMRLDPKTAGLAVDYAGSLDGLTGFTLDPTDLVARLRGNVTRDARLTVQQEGVAAAIRGAASSVETAATDATLAISGGTAVATPAVTGTTVDVPKTVAAVAGGWLRKDPIVGASSSAAPAITDAAVATLKTAVADKILAGPITLSVNGQSFDVAAGAIAKAVTFPASGGRIAESFDAKTVATAVRDAGRKAGVLRAGTNASVTSADGSFHVVPAVDGIDIDPTDALTAVKAAIASDKRSAQVPPVVAAPDFTTAEAKTSIPTGVISTFTTHFPDNPDRTHNITLAAHALDGVYVPPGQQFSLNGLLGQRTPEKGYRGAPVIYDGRLTMDFGRGISQVSTTLFNAVFFSGAQIDEFHPHSFYISRYPMGREATISWPDVDQKFTNTTKGGILIRATVDADSITVTFFGRKTYDVEATLGPRVNITAPKTIHDSSPGCVPQSPSEGFDVTVGRIFKAGGKTVKSTSFTTHYIPEDLVICG